MALDQGQGGQEERVSRQLLDTVVAVDGSLQLVGGILPALSRFGQLDPAASEIILVLLGEVSDHDMLESVPQVIGHLAIANDSAGDEKRRSPIVALDSQESFPKPAPPGQVGDLVQSVDQED